MDPVLRRENIQNIYPLAPVQEGMYFYSKLNNTSSAYLQQVSYRIIGDLKKELVEKSLNKLISRYDILRTVFIQKSNVERVLQIVLKERQVGINFINLTGHEDKEDFIEGFLSEDRKNLFDLAKDPLLRVSMLQIASDEFEFIWSFHHIILDGWSTGGVISEFLSAYNHYLNGKPEQANEVVQYNKYIQWHESQNDEEATDFWKNYLDGYSKTIALPLSYPDNLNKSFKNRTHVHEISEEKINKLKAVTQQQDLTLFSAVQAFWGILLGIYNNTQDIVFGTVVTVRPPEIKNIERMIGLSINTIPIRIKYRADSRIADILKDAQQNIIELEKYQYYPLYKIQNHCFAINPVVDHIIGFENYPLANQIEGIAGSNSHLMQDLSLSISDIRIHEETNYHFNLAIMPKDGLTLRIDFNETVFHPEFIADCAKYFERIIDSFIKNTDLQINQINFLEEQEQKNLLNKFRNSPSEVNLNQNLVELLERQCVDNADSIALISNQLFVTYKELLSRINSFADLLHEKGLVNNGTVVVFLEPSIDYIVSILAILKSGAAFIPIDARTTSERLSVILNDSNTKILVSNSQLIDKQFFTQLLDINKTSEGYYETSSRTNIQELDDLPMVDRSLIDYEKYSSHIGQAMIKGTYINILASRGCPYKCMYCHKIWPNIHKIRSAENIFNEVKTFYDLGIRRFVIIDDIFNLNIKNSSRFFELIIKNKLKIQLFFTGGLRGDILNKEYIDLMAEAGTVNIALALETASKRIQKLINKNLKLDRFHENLKYITDYHTEIVTELFLMHGFPTETEEEAWSTIKYLDDFKWIHFPYLNILRIYNNTDIETLALRSGISKKDILLSEGLAYHELPKTLPFDNKVTHDIQYHLLHNYFLNKERLIDILPRQLKVLTQSEIVEKTKSYLPYKINSLQDLLDIAGIKPGEIDITSKFGEESFFVPDMNTKLKNISPNKRQERKKKALNILLLDLSQHFSTDDNTLYDVFEPPYGIMSLMTYLKDKLKDEVNGLVLKSRVDFNSYEELHRIIEKFKPDVIGVRTLSFYKEFFHKTISLVRQWGFTIPIIAGGPYATSAKELALADKKIDLLVIGEGEVTFYLIIKKIIENGNKLPARDKLKTVDGIAFIDEPHSSVTDSSMDIILIDQHTFENRPKTNSKKNDIQPSNPAYIIYTSGSQGTPKGVIIEHKNLVSYVSAFQQEFKLGKDDRMLHHSSIGFDTSIEEIFPVLLNGATLCIENRNDVLDIEEFGDNVLKKRISIIDTTPLFLKEINNIDKKYLKYVRLFISGGDVLKSSYINNLVSFSDVYNTYGPTETTICATYHKYSGTEHEIIPIGKPIGNCNVLIKNKDIDIVPKLAEGELLIGGKGVARGYLNQVELTNEKFEYNKLLKERIFKSGDKVRYTYDDNILFIERYDNQVKVRGFRIELGEIERTIERHPDIEKAIALIVTDENDNKQIISFYTCKGDCSLATNTVNEFISNYFPSYINVRLFKTDNFPLTNSGKINKQALLESYFYYIEQDSPEGEILDIDERSSALMDVWCKVLKINNLRLTDNFFNVGGDSIKAIQVQSKLGNKGYRLEIKDIFDFPVLKDLSSKLRKKENQFVWKISHDNNFVLSPIQRNFLELNSTPDHFNQSVILRLTNRLPIEGLKGIIKFLYQNNPSFRIKISIEENRYVQKYLPEAPIGNLDLKDLRDISTLDKIEESINKLHQEIRIKENTLFRTAVFNYGGADHLFMAIHHIIVDTVSWRIILEDLTILLEQYVSKKSLILPSPTFPYLNWIETLEKSISEDRLLKKEIRYWEEVSDDFGNDLFKLNVFAYKYSDHAQVTKKLSMDYTKKLINETNTVFNTNINDILLSSLALSVFELTKSESFLIDLESHGRTFLNNEYDISRTTGWFTSAFPIKLKIEKGDIANHIRTIKEMLHKVPNNGIGYGLLKYLKNQEQKTNIDFNKRRIIAFNYLGRFDNEIDNEQFSISEIGSGKNIGDDIVQEYPMEYNCLIKDNAFQLTIVYNKQQFSRHFMDDLLESFLKNLIKLIDFCSDQTGTKYSPSDFSADISIDQFDKISSEVENLS